MNKIVRRTMRHHVLPTATLQLVIIFVLGKDGADISVFEIDQPLPRNFAIFSWLLSIISARLLDPNFLHSNFAVKSPWKWLLWGVNIDIVWNLSFSWLLFESNPKQAPHLLISRPLTHVATTTILTTPTPLISNTPFRQRLFKVTLSLRFDFHYL